MNKQKKFILFLLIYNLIYSYSYTFYNSIVIRMLNNKKTLNLFIKYE